MKKINENNCEINGKKVSNDKKKKSISVKKQLSFIIGAGIAFSNTLLLMLLLYNVYVSMAGFNININGEMVNYHFTDGFEKKLLIAGVAIGIVTTILGVVCTSYFVKRQLRPMKKLADHMALVDRENLIENVQVETPIKEAEILIESFNNMTRRVGEAFENQKNLTSYIAHELRTPLAVIQTKLDVYKKMPEEDKNPDALVAMMDGQISKLNLLINRILELSNIQRIELKELIPISILIEEVFDDLEDKAEEKNVELIMENSTVLSDSALMDVEVMGNHELLYQAFYNLIENAIKYNKENGVVRVVITVENQLITVRIKDTGCGIPASDRDRIFEPFFRCRNDEIREIEGNGIGLALTKKILEHHKGRIYLRETYDYNNCFEIQLEQYMR